MEDTEIQDLAAEPSFVVDERDRLTRELEKLQAGSRTLGKFNVRRVATRPAFVNSTTQTKPRKSSTFHEEDISSYGKAHKSTTSSAPIPISSSQSSHPSSGFDIHSPVPPKNPFSMSGFTTNTSTNNKGIFGVAKNSHVVKDKAQGSNSEPRGLFGSGSGSEYNYGSLFKGVPTDTTANSRPGISGTASPGISNKSLSSKPSLFASVSSESSQTQLENRAPTGRPMHKTNETQR
jgi:hypothetical protein